MVSKNDKDAVNPKIIDTVINVNESIMGVSRAASMSVGFESLAHSLNLIMHNAGFSQYGSKQLELAMVSEVCKKITDAGG